MKEPTKEREKAICMSELDFFYEMAKQCIEKKSCLMTFFSASATHFLSQAIMICKDESREDFIKTIISKSYHQGMELKRDFYERT